MVFGAQMVRAEVVAEFVNEEPDNIFCDSVLKPSSGATSSPSNSSPAPPPTPDASEAAGTPRRRAAKSRLLSFSWNPPPSTSALAVILTIGRVINTPMARHGDGLSEASVALRPGRDEYKFIVDAEWIPDPLSTEQVWNHHGTLNSVIQVRT